MDSGLLLFSWAAAQEALRSFSNSSHHCFALYGMVRSGHCGWSYLASHLHDRERQMTFSLYRFIYSVTYHPGIGFKLSRWHEFRPQENALAKQFWFLIHRFIYLLSNLYGVPTAMHCPRQWRYLNGQGRQSPRHCRACILVGGRQKRRLLISEPCSMLCGMHCRKFIRVRGRDHQAFWGASLRVDKDGFLKKIPHKIWEKEQASGVFMVRLMVCAKALHQDTSGMVKGHQGGHVATEDWFNTCPSFSGL